MTVTLYSNHCPMCKEIQKKLDKLKIEYEEVNDLDIMQDKGFSFMPMLEIDTKIMNSIESMQYLNALEKGE